MDAATKVAVATVAATVLIAAVPALRAWRRSRRAHLDMEFVRTAYGAAHVLIANGSGADATDVAISLKYRENRGPDPLNDRQPFRIERLRARSSPTHIPLFFFPELVTQPLTATVEFTDETGRRTDVFDLTWA